MGGIRSKGGCEMESKKLPVGIDSFEKLRREDFYYIDKTGRGDLLGVVGVRFVAVRAALLRVELDIHRGMEALLVGHVLQLHGFTHGNTETGLQRTKFEFSESRVRFQH